MRSCLLTRCKRYCIGVILILPALLSAWTCSAIEDFKSCPGAVPQPQIHAACSELYLAQRKLSYRCPGAVASGGSGTTCAFFPGGLTDGHAKGEHV